MAIIEKLEAIGNAIRAKTGKSEKLSLDQMPSEIASIESGGGGEENSIEKYFEAQYAEVILPTAKKLKNKVFNGDRTITTVSIPKVKDIGSYAFSDCTYLKTISLSNELETIGERAFYYCTSLELTSLPDSVVNIKDSAFNYCKKMKLTSIPKNVANIGSSAFQQCNRLTSITFKGTPTSISNNAFDSCSNLTTINVPWAEGAVANAPWGATNATINYNYTGE